MTHASEPAYKVGDRVRIIDRNDALFDAVGSIIGVRPGFTRQCKVMFDAGEDDWFSFDHLKHVGPLGVESWRLLFRAHRDGWELVSSSRPDSDGDYYRCWHHAATDATHTFTCRRSVR